MKKLFAVSITLILGLSSCSNYGHLTKRYKSMEIVEDSTFIASNVEVDFYVIEKDKEETPKPKTIFDLSPKGQAALIQELGKKDSSSALTISNIASVLSSKASAPDIIDFSSFEKKIVVSIRNKSHEPADRISKIKIALDIDTVVRLLSCNRISTEYQTLDLGKLNFSTSQGIEGTGNVSIGNGTESSQTGDNSASKKTGSAGASIGAKASASRTFSEEILLKQRIVVLNASINKNKLSLYQDGISGIDLTGNIIADVSFELKDLAVDRIYSFSELSKMDILNDPLKIKVSEKFIIYPNVQNDINAKISFETDYRQVIKHAETITESDDKVNLHLGECKDTIAHLLISKDQFRPKLWVLTFNDTSTIQISGPSLTGSGTLIFNSYSEASEFTVWLKSKFEDAKRELTIGNKKYIIRIPDGFTSIQKIEISPYNK